MTSVAVPARGAVSLRLAGGAMFAASAALVHAGNYAFNVILGRRLGPARFSELSLIVTLLLLVGFVAGTVQTTSARFAATADTDLARAQLAAWMVRRLRPAAIGTGLLIAAVSPLMAAAFRLSSPAPLVVFAAGIPLYLSQAVHRGIVQGERQFGRLAASYQAEMWVRLAGGITFVSFGWSVAGATGALALSFAASWLVVRRRLLRSSPPADADRRQIGTFGTSTGLLLVGEMLICHSDLIIAKLAFDSVTAGSYAAVALLGRVAFFATWPVVAFVFPAVARYHADGRETGRLLTGSVALVATISVLIATAASIAPERILTLAFGPGYGAAAPWLAPYAIATGCFAVANTVFSYHLARGVRTGSWLALSGGGAQLLALGLWHGSVAAVVSTQVVLMAGLLVVALLWHRSLAGNGQ